MDVDTSCWEGGGFFSVLNSRACLLFLYPRSLYCAQKKRQLGGLVKRITEAV